MCLQFVQARMHVGSLWGKVELIMAKELLYVGAV